MTMLGFSDVAPAAEVASITQAKEQLTRALASDEKAERRSHEKRECGRVRRLSFRFSLLACSNGDRSQVGVTGFEPATSSSRTTRSTKLSYTPRCKNVSSPRRALRNGRGRIRTSEGERQQVYSLSPLATWVHALMRAEEGTPRPQSRQDRARLQRSSTRVPDPIEVQPHPT